MSALILKSGNALNENVSSIEFAAYKSRVLANGGYIVDEDAVKEALDFASSNKFASSVFSATSPRWGVKFDGDTLVRLFSLYGEAGDIEVSINAPNNFVFDTTTHGFNTLFLKSSSMNTFKSAGTITSHSNSVLCTVSITPSEGVPYGGSYFKSAIIDTSQGAGGSKRVHNLSQGRIASDPVTEIYPVANGFDVSGQILAKSIKNATVWGSSASYLDNNRLSLFDSGEQVGVDTMLTPSEYRNNLSYYIGVNREPNTASLAFYNPFYGHIVESWCLVNTSEGSAKVLSTRANKVYKG